MELNQQEKEKLAQRLREEMTRKKAEELGVDPSDIMLRVNDGKSSWVKKSEVYVQLDRQRKLVAPPKVMRSLRDGKNSLVSRIHHQVNECRLIINDLSKQKNPVNFNLSEYKTASAKLENRTNSIENQLMEVESRIDRTKAREPIFAQAESVFSKVQDAKGKNDIARADQLLAENKDILGKYEFLRKGLNPYLEEARKYRLELQREYWHILQIRYKLQTSIIQQSKTSLAAMITAIQKEGGSQAVLVKTSELVKEDDLIMRQYNDLASHTPPSHIPSADASSIWDYILPEMEPLIEQQAELQRQFAALTSGQREPGDSSTSRMAFVQKRR